MSFLPRKKIIVPFDFSDQSVAAVDTALQIAGDESEIHLMHVLAELHPADLGVVWQTINEESRSKHATEAIQHRLNEEQYKDLNLHIDIGDPGYRIVEFAEKLGADLIVMPSHGRTGIKRLLIGSVAERVVRLAHCPVLILRT